MSTACPQTAANNNRPMSLREEAMARASAAAATDKQKQQQQLQQQGLASPTGGSSSSSSPQQQGQMQQQAVSQPTAEEARKMWRAHGEDNSQVLENRRLALRSQAHAQASGHQQQQQTTTTIHPGAHVPPGAPHDGGQQHYQQHCQQSQPIIFSVRVVSAEDRVDPAGSYYTAYLMEVESSLQPQQRYVVEHRYSEFARLNSELVANKIRLRSSFPTKSLCGRLGNWTPAQHWAPERMAELVTYRKIKLDIWLVELAELLARGEGDGKGGGDGMIPRGEVRDMCMEFFQRSAAGCPPCDRANPVDWKGLNGSSSKRDIMEDGGDLFSDGSSTRTMIDPPTTQEQTSSSSSSSPTRHAGGTEKILSNPVSFTLGGEIRKATYLVGHMCGPSALAADRSIPLDLLHQAKGLCFLTVIKMGCVISGRVGTGLIVARTKDGSGWSPPSAIGTVGLGYGALIGGDITSYLIVLTTQRAVSAFAGRGSVSLGAELGMAVGPVGRGATGNLAGGEGGIASAYSYAHSKGFFAGISLEGSVVACRPDVNAKFYGRPVDANMLLFESGQWRPRAAQPLYEALDEALGAEIKGFRPSQIGKIPNGPIVPSSYQQQQQQIPAGGGPPSFFGNVGGGVPPYGGGQVVVDARSSHQGPSATETIVDGSTAATAAAVGGAAM